MRLVVASLRLLVPSLRHICLYLLLSTMATLGRDVVVTCLHVNEHALLAHYFVLSFQCSVACMFTPSQFLSDSATTLWNSGTNISSSSLSTSCT